jgi:hypothetical protein
MINEIIYKGIIHFDPEDKTRKHLKQSDWKKMALIVFDSDIAEYYAWFLKKRYDIVLNKPLRRAHISFINDSISDIKKGLKCDDITAQKSWTALKKKWNNVEVEVALDLDVRSDSNHWWLNIPQDKRDFLHSIRNEIGLSRPYFGLHMSIGYANEKNIKQSKYILNLINEFGKEYN